MKVGWILYGGRGIASARIQGWNIHDYLINYGISSKILDAPKKQWNVSKGLSLTREQIDALADEKFDIIIVQKKINGSNFEYLVENIHKRNKKIVNITVDLINTHFCELCDAVLVVSDKLKELLPKSLHKKTYVVFDSYEGDVSKYKTASQNKKITLSYLTSKAECIFPKLEKLPQKVSMIIIGPSRKRMEELGSSYFHYSNITFPHRYIDWSLESVNQSLLKGDVGIIPIDDSKLENDQIKSSHRLLQLMVLGLPTIVSPLKEYKKIINNGVNGFIANTNKEWQDYIKYLRDNPIKRKEMGYLARETVLKKFSVQNQALLYLDIFKKVLNG